MIFKTESVPLTGGKVVELQYYCEGEEVTIPQLPDETYICWDKTYDEILSALSAGESIVVHAVKDNQ